jgi:hypothetical protein
MMSFRRQSAWCNRGRIVVKPGSHLSRVAHSPRCAYAGNILSLEQRGESHRKHCEKPLTMWGEGEILHANREKSHREVRRTGVETRAVLLYAVLLDAVSGSDDTVTT